MTEALLVFASGREERHPVPSPAPPEYTLLSGVRRLVFRRRLGEWRPGVAVYDEYRHEVVEPMIPPEEAKR